MALEKSIVYKGIDVEKAYFKLCKFNAEEKTAFNFPSKNEEEIKVTDKNGNKFYIVVVTVKCFSSGSKENELDPPGNYKFQMIEKEISLKSFYLKLKTLDQFKGAKDA